MGFRLLVKRYTIKEEGVKQYFLFRWTRRHRFKFIYLQHRCCFQWWLPLFKLEKEKDVNLETLQDLGGGTLVQVEGLDFPLFALEVSDFRIWTVIRCYETSRPTCYSDIDMHENWFPLAISCFDVCNIKSVCVIIGFSCKSLKHDMLNHPELLELNATLAFEATIWRKQPSNHCVFVGEWHLSKRYPAFGATMSVLLLWR